MALVSVLMQSKKKRKRRKGTVAAVVSSNAEGSVLLNQIKAVVVVRSNAKATVHKRRRKWIN